MAGLPLQNGYLDMDLLLGPVAGSSDLPITLFFDANGNLLDRDLGALPTVPSTCKLRLFQPADPASPGKYIGQYR